MQEARLLYRLRLRACMRPVAILRAYVRRDVAPGGDGDRRALHRALLTRRLRILYTVIWWVADVVRSFLRRGATTIPRPAGVLYLFADAEICLI